MLKFTKDKPKLVRPYVPMAYTYAYTYLRIRRPMYMPKGLTVNLRIYLGLLINIIPIS